MGEGKTTTTTTADRMNLLGLTQPQLEQFFESISKERFRAGQVMKWIYHFGVNDFDIITNVSKTLHEELKTSAEIRGPGVVSRGIFVDGTRKWMVRVALGSRVEAVYILWGGRGALCVSPQAGCALDCSFCSVGKQDFSNDLIAAEMIGQVQIASKSFGTVLTKIDRAVTNVMIMGMSEPLLNFDNMITAMNIMMDDLGYDISKRKMTLFTSGMVPMIDKLGEVIDVSLALSLHAPSDGLRNKSAPINEKYPLDMLLDACRRYVSQLDEKHVLTVEYTLLKDVDDQPEHAEQIIVLLKDTPYKINLISLNPLPYFGYGCPSNDAIRRFQDMLRRDGFNVTVHTTHGDDTDAACSRLVDQVVDRTRRSERYTIMRRLTESGSAANRD